MVRYLLGELSEEEKTKFEEMYFLDDHVFEDLQIVETELVDCYIRDEFSEAEQQRFRTHYLNSTERRAKVETAKCLMAAIAATGVPKPFLVERKPVRQAILDMFASVSPSLRFTFAAAAVAILAFVSLTIVQNERLRSQLTQSRREQAEVVRGEQGHEQLEARTEKAAGDDQTQEHVGINEHEQHQDRKQQIDKSTSPVGSQTGHPSSLASAESQSPHAPVTSRPASPEIQPPYLTSASPSMSTIQAPKAENGSPKTAAEMQPPNPSTELPSVNGANHPQPSQSASAKTTGENQRAEPPSEAVPTTALAKQATAFISLTPGLARGAQTEADNTLVVARKTQWIGLELSLDDDAYPGGYSAVVETSSGAKVKRMDRLKAQTAGEGGKSIVVRLPAKLFSSDTYVVRLLGLTENGKEEEVNGYSFQVVRR
jgi:hypothetical protein